MGDRDRLLSLMKTAVELMRESQEKRKEHREGKISDAEAKQFLKDYTDQFNAVQQKIGEEMKKQGACDEESHDR
jgi:DnaJ-domain-containing protein 1